MNHIKATPTIGVLKKKSKQIRKILKKKIETSLEKFPNISKKINSDFFFFFDIPGKTRQNERNSS